MATKRIDAMIKMHKAVIQSKYFLVILLQEKGIEAPSSVKIRALGHNQDVHKPTEDSC